MDLDGNCNVDSFMRLLKYAPNVYAVIVKCDHNFLDFQSFDKISFVLVSDIEGGNFKPKIKS